MNKRVFCIILICVSFIVLVIYLVSFAEPKVIIDCSIEPVDKSYEERNGATDMKKEELIIMKLSVKTIQPLFIISNRNIVVDDLDKAFLKDERVKYVSGSRFRQDNQSELKSTYEQRANVALREITISEFIALLDDIKVTIEWDKRFNGKEKRIYYIKDYLTD